MKRWTEAKVEQLLKETTTEKGMSIENARIECPAKPITHAFIYFKNDDVRNKYVRSANMLRKELIDQWTQRKDFIRKNGICQKYCINTRHNIRLNSMSLNWTSKYVWVSQVYQVPGH